MYSPNRPEQILVPAYTWFGLVKKTLTVESWQWFDRMWLLLGMAIAAGL
jgi:hypothetical protein